MRKHIMVILCFSTVKKLIIYGTLNLSNFLGKKSYVFFQAISSQYNIPILNGIHVFFLRETKNYKTKNPDKMSQLYKPNSHDEK